LANLVAPAPYKTVVWLGKRIFIIVLKEKEMINLSRLCFTLAFLCLHLPAATARDLPSDWSKTYVADEWQGKCETIGRGGCRDGNTYYYDSSTGILVRFITYDQKVIELFVSSTQDPCANGRLSIDGDLAMELLGNGDHCSVVGGKQFRYAERITNSQSQLDIGMFLKAKTIAIDIELSSGEKMNVEIPMKGFDEKLDAAKGSGH
jgi:hypothetical protein